YRLGLAGLLSLALTFGGCPPTTPPDNGGSDNGSTGNGGGTGSGGSSLGNGSTDGNNGPPKPGGGGGDGGQTTTSAPVIADIPDGTIGTGQSYTGPTPTITANSAAVIWTLVAGPSDLAIASDTGIVTWARASTGTYNIQIKATG